MMTTIRNFCLLLSLLLCAGLVQAATNEIGKIKTLSGDVQIKRDGQQQAATLGAPVYQKDAIVTGNNGKIGLLFKDDSRLSVGPNSSIAMQHFKFDPKTDDGQFDVAIKKGTLSVISGKMTAKKPGSLRVKTPAAILAVRGTEFSIKIDDGKTE